LLLNLPRVQAEWVAGRGGLKAGECEPI
jgi:hypothetical protein